MGGEGGAWECVPVFDCPDSLQMGVSRGITFSGPGSGTVRDGLFDRSVGAVTRLVRCFFCAARIGGRFCRVPVCLFA